MISILKKCHIYWNSLRMKNQLSKAKEDTKVLIQSIGKIYLIRDQMIKQITSVIFKKIHNIFNTFNKANKMYELINEEAP